MAYEDWGDSHKAIVMKFDGNNWENVGNAGFSAGQTSFTSLAFSPSGQPCVAFEDYGNSGKATVMKFNGINWVNVGEAGFSAGDAHFTSLAFSTSGAPFLAYMDFGNLTKVTVMKYDSLVGIIERHESRLSFYPNPASEIITIKTSSIPIQGQLSLMNINGQVRISRQITEPKTQLDISTLPDGVYFLRLTGERTVQVGKFVKHKD